MKTTTTRVNSGIAELTKILPELLPLLPELLKLLPQLAQGLQGLTGQVQQIEQAKEALSSSDRRNIARMNQIISNATQRQRPTTRVIGSATSKINK